MRRLLACTCWLTVLAGCTPPPEAANGDPAFRTLRSQQINRADITGIKTCLSEGRVVAFSVPVFLMDTTIAK